MKPTAPDYAKHDLAQAVIALMVFTMASIFAAASARTDPSRVDESQDPTGQDASEESNRTNNGGDITRPQTAFEIRTFDRTSSNETSKTNDAQMLLRMSSKIPLDTSWRISVGSGACQRGDDNHF